MIRKLRRLRQDSAGNLSVLGLLALEFAAIVAAVVVGFMVNEWREGRSRARVVDSALTALAQEMRYNHQQIVANYEYYTLIMRRIQEHREQQQTVPAAEGRPVYGYHLPDWRGALPPMLRSSTWQMMVSTGTVADLPFEDADTLAKAYNYQAMLETLDQSMIAKFANDPAFTRIETVHHMFNMYVEIMPSIIGFSQAQGRPILARYGYDLDIDHQPLLEESERQMAGYSR